ncbi:MAG: tetratricopeptide repeat protein, partial [Bryobacteraceae bacterium]
MRQPPTLATLLEDYESAPQRLEPALAVAEALAARSEVDNAVTRLSEACSRFPRSALPWSLRGDILAEAGRAPDAISCYVRALELDRTNAHVCSRIGNLCQNEGRSEEAFQYFLKLLRLRPSDPDPYRGLARTVAESTPPTTLVDRVRALCQPRCDEGKLQAGVGWALFELGRYTEARDCFRKRLEEDPQDWPVLLNLARSEDCAGNAASAKALFERGLSVPEPFPDLVRSFAEHLIRTGSIEDAKTLYRSFVRRMPGTTSHSATAKWRGEPAGGKTFLIKNDAGLGDTIQFVRFAALLKELGALTIVECQPALVELISTFMGADLVIAPYSPHPPADYSVESQFMGLMLDWDWESLRRYMPYLKAPSPHASGNGASERQSGNLRVGISWHGNQLWRCDPNRYRSLPLADLAPLSAIPAVDLFSLQFGPGAEQVATAPFRVRQLDAGGFSVTAASVQSLDLVVSIDTAVAHLACALGKPCFIMLP